MEQLQRETGNAKAILFAITGWDPAPWVDAAGAGNPERPVFLWPDVPDADSIAYALAWKPAPGALTGLPNLKAIFSLGAGVDHLIFRDDLPDVPIVRVVDNDLTERMTEWVVLQVLIHHRLQRLYDRQQRERVWRERSQPAAHEVRVGIMGMGVLGRRPRKRWRRSASASPAGAGTVRPCLASRYLPGRVSSMPSSSAPTSSSACCR